MRVQIGKIIGAARYAFRPLLVLCTVSSKSNPAIFVDGAHLSSSFTRSELSYPRHAIVVVIGRFRDARATEGDDSDDVPAGRLVQIDERIHVARATVGESTRARDGADDGMRDGGDDGRGLDRAETTARDETRADGRTDGWIGARFGRRRRRRCTLAR